MGPPWMSSVQGGQHIAVVAVARVAGAPTIQTTTANAMLVPDDKADVLSDPGKSNLTNFY